MWNGPNRLVAKRLFLREIRSTFLNSVSGPAWLLVTPVLLLLVYTFVFGVIFRARVPQDLEASFVAWLAIALWPWLAFSDGILKGSQAIGRHRALISKVAVPRSLLTASTLSAAFVLQLCGYLIVLGIVAATGTNLHWASGPYVFLLLVILYVFSLGLGLMLSALQVFIRDFEQLLPTALMFWFFLTPILYVPEMLPDPGAFFLTFNPMTWFIEELRAAFFQDKWFPDHIFLGLVTGSILSLWAGKNIFDRLSPHFEDFL